MQNLIFVAKNGARVAIKQKTNKRRQVEHVEEKKLTNPHTHSVKPLII